MVTSIPNGFHSLSSYFTVKGGAAAIEFYKKAFGAIEKGRLTMPDGSVGHAELQIGDSRFMLGDENLAWGNKSPETLGGTPAGLCLYVKDVDTVFKNAIEAGAKETMPVSDQFYGDRSGTVLDPFGHKWTIATHKEDMSFEEMQKRMDVNFKV